MIDASYEQLRERLARTLAGRYTVGALLGAGGMAAVFRAQDVALERTVAIKVLPPDLLRDDKLVSRFEQEAKIAAKLDHPHIIPIYRVESESGLNYFVMKFVNGRSLDALLAAGEPLDSEFTERVLLEAADALGHAHERGVVHRDVKPANIMLDADERVILTDFGISKAMESASGLTNTGIIVGTPHYMAPEQAMGQSVDGRADQYALACVGYQMLTGALPFPGEIAHSVLHRHIYEEAKPLAVRRPNAPRAMVHAIGRAMAKAPEQRFASMEAFAAALEGMPPGLTPARGARASRSGARRGPVAPTVAMETPTAPVGTTATAEFQQRLRASRRWRVARWVGGLALVAVAGAAIARQGPTNPPRAIAPASADSLPVRHESTAGAASAAADSATKLSAAPPPPAPASARSIRPSHAAAPKPAPAPVIEAATLNVDSDPFGTVYLDNKQLGDTPLYNVPLVVGRSYELRVVHDGYKPYRETIRADGPNPMRRRLHLDQLP